MLNQKNVPRYYIDNIQNIYEETVIIAHYVDRILSEFLVTVGLYQKLVLSLSLFTLAMDELTRKLHDKVSWYMLFVDNIVQVDEPRES